MRRAVLLLFVLSNACGGENPSEFLIYDRDAADGSYRMQREPIDTLTNPRRGRGELAVLRAGGKLVVSLGPADTEEQIKDGLRVRGDGDPDIRFEVRDNGVGMPFDFDSAMMLSLYHHIEQASRFFAALGVSPQTMRRLPVYYGTDLKIPFVALPGPLFADNAAYVVTIDSFVVPPRWLLKDDVPLCANRGVVTHEYSHAVFNRVAQGDRRVPAYMVEDWPSPVINELRSLDEGLADTFAVLALGDPDFIRPSISPDIFDIDRDASVERHYDDAKRQAVLNDDDLTYDPYALGSVVASAVWSLRGSASDSGLAAAILRAMGALAPVDAGFTLSHFFDLLAAELPAGTSACQLFHNRLDAVAGDLTCIP